MPNGGYLDQARTAGLERAGEGGGAHAASPTASASAARMRPALPWPAEVECHAFHFCPEIELLADELGAIVGTDRFAIAELCRAVFKRRAVL